MVVGGIGLVSKGMILYIYLKFNFASLFVLQIVFGTSTLSSTPWIFV